MPISDLFLFLFLLSLPTQLALHFWPPFSFIFGLKIDYLAPKLYLQDIIFLLVLIFNKNSLFSKLKTIKKESFFLVFFLFVVNLYFSLNRYITLFAWIRFFEFFLLFFLVSSQKKKFFPMFVKLLPFFVFFEFFLSLYQMVYGKSANGIFWIFGERKFNLLTPGIAKTSLFGKVFLRPYGTFSHPNSLAGFFLVVFIFLFFIPKKTILEKISLFFCFLIILFSYSQSALFSLFLFFLLSFLTPFFPVKIKSQKIIFIFLFILISAFSFLPLLIEKNFSSPSLIDRNFLLQSSLLIFKQKPLFGVGLNNFIIALSKLEIFSGKKYLFQPVHNIFLLSLNETGILGFSLLMYFLSKLFIKILNTREKNQRQTYFFVFLAFLFTGFFDHYWFTLIQNQLLISLLFGLIAF